MRKYIYELTHSILKLTRESNIPAGKYSTWLSNISNSVSERMSLKVVLCRVRSLFVPRSLKIRLLKPNVCWIFFSLTSISKHLQQLTETWTKISCLRTKNDFKVPENNANRYQLNFSDFFKIISLFYFRAIQRNNVHIVWFD